MDKTKTSLIKKNLAGIIIFLFMIFMLADNCKYPEQQFISKIEVHGIKLYRKTLHKLLSRNGKIQVCRYTPTCSLYTERAIHKYGFLKGNLMGVYRIARCNPFSKGGVDEP